VSEPLVIVGNGMAAARVVGMARPFNRGFGLAWIWLASEGPVVFATAKGGRRRCVLDARIIIAAAGFKQENADIGVLGQSPRRS
jgi:hypothetical protein